jgi:hypothetical protein
MSRTIEAIIRRMAASSNPPPHQRNGTGTLEKEITAKERRYIWMEAGFVRGMAPLRCDLRVAFDGNEVVGKSVLELNDARPPEGLTVRIRAESSMLARRCTQLMN